MFAHARTTDLAHQLIELLTEARLFTTINHSVKWLIHYFNVAPAPILCLSTLRRVMHTTFAEGFSMKYLLMAIGLSLGFSLSPIAAKAENLMLEYYATLSPRDTYNSSGAPLNDVCAIVQQDRANVHKFGNPDGEQPDSFFTSPARRAMIAGRCDYSRSHHTVDRIRNQVIGFVLVRVYGSGGSVTRVQVLEAAG